MEPDEALYALLTEHSYRVLAHGADVYEVARHALVYFMPLVGKATDAGRAYILWAEISDLLDSPSGPQSLDVCETYARAAAREWLLVDTAAVSSVDSFFGRWQHLEQLPSIVMGADVVCYVLDGHRFSGLSDFYRHIGEAVNGPGGYFGSNLDALSDCLSGGFGTPEPEDQAFQFVWINSDVARVRLGYPETAQVLRARLTTCHRSNVPVVQAQMKEALKRQGSTVFDWIVEIFDRQRVPLLLK